MATAAVATAMNLSEQQNIHPFFTKPQRPQSPGPTEEVKPTAAEFSLHDENHPEQPETAERPRSRGRPMGSKTQKGKRKTGGPLSGSKVKQPSLAQFTQAGNGKENKADDDTRGEKEAAFLEEDPNIDRRKRQRTQTPEVDQAETEEALLEAIPRDNALNGTAPSDVLSWHQQLETESKIGASEIQVEASSPDAGRVQLAPGGSDAIACTSPTEEGGGKGQTPSPASSPPSPEANIEQAQGNDNDLVVAESSPPKATPPRKMLRLNARGRFSSPISNAPALPSSPSSLPAVPESIEMNHEAGSELAVHKSPSRESPPKRMLRLNSRGRFSSPVPKASEELTEASKPKRTRRGGAKKEPKQCIVKMSYARDGSKAASIAEEIDQILAGTKRAPDLKPKQTPKPVKPVGPPKPTHPFFTGKGGRKNKEEMKHTETSVPKSPAKPDIRRETAITPGKLRAQARASHVSPDFPSFGMDAKKKKHPGGTVDAPWPWKGVVRVGDGTENLPTAYDRTASEVSPKDHRKQKNHVYQILEKASLLSILSQELQQGLADPQHMTPGLIGSGVLRKPERLLTTGVDMQDRIREQVHGFHSVHSTQSSEILTADRQLGSSQYTTHPTLKVLYDEIETTLTPFDNGTCETLPWVHKYAPKRAVDVLGSPREVGVIRQWLEALRVSAVEVGSKEPNNSPSSSKKRATAGKPPKKKRKKTEDMNDFIVDDDEDVLEELDELSDLDDPISLNSGHGTKRSMIRQGDGIVNGLRSTKLNNIILISGPHGSGKTAAVFAVAKELDFEIFEINSSSRRSGKDVFEKIGDMTENHLVQRRIREPVAAVTEQGGLESDSEQRLTAAVQKDIESGRQKSMASFFKPMNQVNQETAKPMVKKQRETMVSAPQKTEQATLGSKPKQSQKQSLILLEEVDVLFEEDKNFWMTVENLALVSKRPIILTCTDEDLVPIPDSSFHAILRMSPAPVDLATDYMLLLAAREGHLLERDAISSLYNSKSHDLRASIMELDFWCQMAVGDQKGGLEWMYQRWPPGKDLDERGQTLRIASCGTYQKGMGWFSRDILLEPSHVGFDRDHELLLELNETWRLQAEECALGLTLNQHAEQEGQSSPVESELKALQDLERSLDTFSAADVYCRVGVPTRSKPEIDATQPPMQEQSKGNYINGYRLLQADTLHDFTNFGMHLYLSAHLAAGRYYTCQETAFENGKEMRLYRYPVIMTPPLSEHDIIDSLLTHTVRAHDPTLQPLRRTNFFTLDPLAEPPTSASAHGQGLTTSSLDRNFSLITTDLAPYVRSIAAYDVRLESERLRVSNLLSVGGTGKRKMRTTRAARSALEGGRRETTRRERWFEQKLDLQAVLATGGKEWAGLGSRESIEEDKQTETDRMSEAGSNRSVEMSEG